MRGRALPIMPWNHPSPGPGSHGARSRRSKWRTDLFHEKNDLKSHHFACGMQGFVLIFEYTLEICGPIFLGQKQVAVAILERHTWINFFIFFRWTMGSITWCLSKCSAVKTSATAFRGPFFRVEVAVSPDFADGHCFQQLWGMVNFGPLVLLWTLVVGFVAGCVPTKRKLAAPKIHL